MRRGNVMDNYDLSNLLLLADCADTRERHPRPTDEQNRRETFSGRSATVGTSERDERQQLATTGDEQIPEQRMLTDFDISLASTTSATIAITVDEPEDPFAALAAYAARAAYHYQLLTFNDDTGQPLNSNLGLFGNINTSSEAVLAELEGNDVVELSEQSQGESDTQDLIVFESTIPETVSDKRRAPEPRNVVIGDLPESVIKESSRRSYRLAPKRQKLDSTDTELLPLPRGTVTESQASTMPEKSATSRKNTKRQDSDESLRKRVKEETNKWIVECKGPSAGKWFMCSYPDCGWTCSTRGNLQGHIFNHTRISRYKCTYPECSDKPYFRDSAALQRHVQSKHTHEKPYHCTICNMCFGRSDSYKRHMRRRHIAYL